MVIRAKKELDRLMGRNLKRLREERGLSQEQLAEMIESDRRYISALENGRGIGDSIMQRLCRVFEVEEEAFAPIGVNEQRAAYDLQPEVTRMLLEEVRTLPEYEQLRLLADLKEKRVKGDKK
jgi:transcriptional regulator with XRE-family HTH domain